MKGLRRLVIVELALVLLLLAVRAGVDLWASRRVSAEMAKLEAQHGSLDIGTLLVAPVPENENRARAMRAAAALVVDQANVEQSLTRLHTERGPMAVPADLKAFVESNRAAVRVADEARSRRLSNWDVDYRTLHYAPGLLEIRRLSTVLYLDARMELDAGRTNEAAGALATGLALSASLRQEPSLISQLIRCAVALQHFEGVQRLITEADPSEASLAALSRALEENRAPAPMHLGLLAELKTFSRTLGLAADGDVVSLLRASNQAEVSRRYRPFAWLLRPAIRVAQARYLEQMGRLLDAEAGPRPRRVVTAAPPRWSLVPGAVASGTAGLENAMNTGDVHASTLALTELAVALRRYRLERGEYPENLAALSPTYLANVPADALTGKPFAYARQAGGFTLRSEHPKAVERPTTVTLAWTVAR
jgi:hypothetical protein